MSQRNIRILLTIAALGLAARFVLLAISYGSSDAQTWERVGRECVENGVLATYQRDLDCNQPPGQVLWAGLAYRLGRATHIGFPPWFKLPMVLSDVVVAGLLWRLWRRRAGAGFAAAATALYAWSPAAILVSAHHGNGDPVYAMFALLAVYLIADREADFAGGLALGMGINVKLVPVLLILPLLLNYRQPKRAVAFFAGLAVMAIPSLIVLALIPEAFYRHVLAYNSFVNHWGIQKFLLDALTEAKFSTYVPRVIELYHLRGKYLVVLATVLLAVYQRRTQRLDWYRLAACTMALFLILTPGFGIQYVVAVVPLIFAADVGRAVLYSALCGMMLLVTYVPMWDGTFPIHTFGGGNRHGPSPTFALLAWAVLVAFVWSSFRRKPGATQEASADPPPAP